MLAAILLAEAFGAAPASAAPEFVTQPSDIYDQYKALREPRADLPVGALWVQDYGPHGEGAAADNLVTVRSLSGIALSGDMQLRLTLGLAALLNLEPGYSRRISARFTDISIVRVKELAQLSGPAGEPRIYEALKAGTINVTTDRDMGLDLGGALEVRNLPVVARADTGGKKSFTIDGRDLFIAFRVAKSLPSATERKEVVLKQGGNALEVALRGYRLRLEWPGRGDAAGAGAGGAHCPRAVDLTLQRPSRDGDASKLETRHDFGAASPARIEVPLPVPVADGEGGLLTKLIVEPARGALGTAEADDACARPELRLSAWLEGARLKSVPDPEAPGW